MLADRHQLDMREAQFGDVVGQFGGKLIPVVETAVAAASPRADMRFVDADRRLSRIGLPTVRRQWLRKRSRGDTTGGAGSQFAGIGIRIGLERQ
jgi:hypothetical protein